MMSWGGGAQDIYKGFLEPSGTMWMFAVLALKPLTLSACGEHGAVGTWGGQLHTRLSHLPGSDKLLKDR